MLDEAGFQTPRICVGDIDEWLIRDLKLQGARSTYGAWAPKLIPSDGALAWLVFISWREIYGGK